MKYRNEYKFAITKIDAAILKKQLALVCRRDPNSVSDEYSYDIRSLYFDDAMGSAYDDKINGEMIRKKYRIRVYNYSFDNIKLECKHKDYTQTYKEEQTIDTDTCRKLAAADYREIKAEPGTLLERFLADAKSKGLKAAVIVDYRRTAFVYPVSDIRITFDENIKSGRYELDMFKKDINMFDVYDDDFVEIEIKFNEFIPDHILGILNSTDKCRLAISKFALAGSLK